MIERFYWLVSGAVAGCSRPGSGHDGRGDGEDRAVRRDLSWLRDRDIGAVLSLTEIPLGEVAVAASRLQVLHLPVPDLTAPRPDQLTHALRFIDRQRSHGRAVAVHCLQGQGRTGTVLAAYLIRNGMPAEDAIERLRVICPGALSVEEQEGALYAFAQRRDWLM